MQQLHYLVPLFISTALGLVLTRYAARRRSAPGALAFMTLMLAAAVWSIGYAFELSATDLATKLLWAKVEYLGIVSIAPAWFVFFIQYTERPRWLTHNPKGLAALAIVPATTLVLVWTNDLHGLIWSRTGLDAAGSIVLLDVDYGPWFWVHSAYSYVLLLLGSIWFVVMLPRLSHLYRLQTAVALLGMLAPWIGNVLFLTGLGPTPGLDLTPFAFSVAGLAYAWSLLRLHLLDIVPVARRAVVDGLADGVIVLDARNRIVDVNPAAQRIVGASDLELIGRRIDHALGDYADLFEQQPGLNAVQSEVALEENNAREYYDLQISPLTNPFGDPIGRLVVLHNITGRKQSEEALRQQNEYLAALHETTLGLIERLDQTSLLETIVARAASLMRTPHGYLYVAEPSGTDMVLRVGIGIFADAVGSRLRSGDELGSRLSETGRTLTAKDYPDWSYHVSEMSRLRTVVGIPLRAGTQVIGIIGLAYAETGRLFASDQTDLLDRFGQLASLALQNARLYAAAQEELSERKRVEAKLQQAKDGLETRVAERTAALRRANEQLLRELAKRQQAEVDLRNLAGRLELIREEEKARIARVVHDELGQMLTALKMDVAWLGKRLPENHDQLQQKARAILELVGTTIQSVQRISAELRPGVLDNLGLVAALEWESQQFQTRTDIDCRLDLAVDDEGIQQLHPKLATALFRIVQETLTNVARHAQATSVTISLVKHMNQLQLITGDNGRGITSAQVSDPKSLGLMGIRERLRPWQGELEIEGSLGAGTTVTVTVPLRLNDAESQGAGIAATIEGGLHDQGVDC